MQGVARTLNADGSRPKCETCKKNNARNAGMSRSHGCMKFKRDCRSCQRKRQAAIHPKE